MSLINIVVLAVIEGITEFLPISSTGHLIVAQKLLGVTTINEFLTIVLQLGAIFAALVFFRRKIISILKDSLKSIKAGKIGKDKGVLILIAIIPTLIIGFVAKDYLNQLQNSLLLVAFCTIFFGIVFYFVERFYLKLKQRKNWSSVGLKELLLMGIAQGVAIFPGVSRSGATIATGLAQGVEFKDSIEISFIMGIPVMFAASFYELIKNLKDFNSDLLFVTIVGFIVAFMTGLIGIKLTLGYLLKNGFYPFMIYRFILGALLLGLVAAGV